LGAKLLKGEYFSDRGNYLSDKRSVKGASLVIIKGSYGKPVSKETVYFNLLPKTVMPAWSECNIESEIVGYVKRQEGGYSGTEVWGFEYAPYFPSGRVGYDRQSREYLGKWLKAKVPLYEKLPKNVIQPRLDDDGHQLFEEVCLTQRSVVISDRYRFGAVLGEATESAAVEPQATESTGASESAELAGSLESEEATEAAIMTMDVVSMGSSSGGLELVSLQSTVSASTKVAKATDVVKYQQKPSTQAVISSAMATYLGMPQNKAVGERFEAAYILVKNLVSNESGKLTTETVNYQVVGVIEDDSSEYFYIPLSDMQKIGLRNYSQLKVVVNDKKNLPQVRHDIEVLGVNTSSTADTVAQIESFFLNVRLLLGLLGTIALAVAALGMFNTLTVSLLERTREIGGMKTMGMVSEEIQELFLSEAMIMGFAGGIGGLFLGFLAGEGTSLLFSVIAISRGVGYLKLSYIPLFLILFILSSSFMVGLVTGLYPAHKAKKTSALNALRYE
jgi:ABC-type lipoprotein release transport system permease subunit